MTDVEHFLFTMKAVNRPMNLNEIHKLFPWKSRGVLKEMLEFQASMGKMRVNCGGFMCSRTFEVC